MSVERRLFSTDPQHQPLRRLLLALDGSTTRVCEALAEQPMQVLLHHQRQTTDVPAGVRDHLGGNAWLERVTSLHADGRVLMDNLSFTRLDSVPDWFLKGLDAGAAPIGHLLQDLFVQREALPTSPEMADRLWRHVGLPDARASRMYRIVTERAPLMLIFEVYRNGMVVPS